MASNWHYLAGLNETGAKRSDDSDKSQGSEPVEGTPVLVPLFQNGSFLLLHFFLLDQLQSMAVVPLCFLVCTSYPSLLHAIE